MNANDYMRRHGLTDDMLDALAAPYESGYFPHEDGAVHVGSHHDAVGSKRVTVIYPAEDAKGMERIARSRGCKSSEVYRQAVRQFLAAQ